MKWTVESLYLRRPTPEYGQAFDVAAMALNQHAGQALAVLSSPTHAGEILKRCFGALAVARHGAFDVSQWVTNARHWAWGPLEAVTLESPAQPAYTALLWAEPEGPSAVDIARALRRSAQPGATLAVIATTPLRRFLPAWQMTPRPAQHPLSPGRTLHLLRKAGWQIERVMVFHGPRAVGWSAAYRLAERLGRSDWADRCLFAMRSNYREPGWLWPFAPLALIRAQAA